MRRLFHVVLLLTLLVALPTVAWAHEGRTVGPYELYVGFLNEPAIAGQPNAATLRIRTKADEKPVTGAASSLKVQIIFGSQMSEYSLVDTATPGTYAAAFTPPSRGDYLFRFFGDIGEREVDETFEPGPDTFSTVEDAATIAARGSQQRTLYLVGGAVVLAGVAGGTFLLRRQQAKPKIHVS